MRFLSIFAPAEPKAERPPPRSFSPPQPSASSASSPPPSSSFSSSAFGASSTQACACFSLYLHDKRVVQEQMFLERHVDAYHLVACLLDRYPPHLIQNDADLVEVLYRFELTARAYRLLEQDTCAANLRRKPTHFSQLVQKFSFRPSSSSAFSSSGESRDGVEDGNALSVTQESAEGTRGGEKREQSEENCFHAHREKSVSLACRSPDCALRQFCERDQSSECNCGHQLRDLRLRGIESRAQREGDRASTPATHQSITENEEKEDEEDSSLCVGDFPVLPGTLLERVMQQPLHPLVTGRKPNAWHHSVEEEDMRVFVRNYADNRELLTFRIEGDVEAPLEAILSVLNEVDLFKTWVPYFSRPVKLGLRDVVGTSLGRVDQLVQFHVDFPWPLSNRDALFEVWAVDDFERNSQIAVKMTTLDHESPSPRHRVPVTQPAEGVERMCVDGNLVIIPRGSNASFLRLLWHTNCRMHVPMKMVEFVSKIFSRGAFSAFQSACKAAMTGEHEARRTKNRFLYGFIEDRLRDVGLIGGTIKIPAGPEVSGEQTTDTEFHGDSAARRQEEEDDDEFFDPEEDDDGDSRCPAHRAPKSLSCL
uniref:Putative START-2 domain protein n=1 Tax=Toxoplasma gondii TgCATBr9 TaxID=943120 RepID=A0A2T6IIG0_TOXGO|nr:putative START-2 domain protein [Toxoplasma gondii TgCATBr9]